MNWLPVGGFLAALAITTLWFDQLEGDRHDETMTSLMVQMVYAVTWGLLGAALVLIYAMSAPDTVAEKLTVLGGGIAVASVVDLFGAFTKRGGFAFRDLRWVVAGIVVFGATYIVMQDLGAPKSAQAYTIHRKFANQQPVEFQ
jgi:hypothetical protein